jgi:N-acetylglucosamine kinase-like BadF-type ATPase
MNEESARRYGRFARQLFALTREGDPDAVDLFLENMSEAEVREMLKLMIGAGGRL